jgi:hypothetical protein
VPWPGGADVGELMPAAIAPGGPIDIFEALREGGPWKRAGGGSRFAVVLLGGSLGRAKGVVAEPGTRSVLILSYRRVAKDAFSTDFAL